MFLNLMGIKTANKLLRGRRAIYVVFNFDIPRNIRKRAVVMLNFASFAWNK